MTNLRAWYAKKAPPTAPRYTFTDIGWSCNDCGALVAYPGTHDAWHERYSQP